MVEVDKEKLLNKHDRILKAALKVFAEKGFYNTRISDIAKEADVADGTIYLYFKNKDDLLISLFEEEVGKICNSMKEEMSKTSDLVEKLRVFASSHLNLVLKNRELAEVMQVELRQSAKFMREYVNKSFINYINLLREVIHEGQKKGIFRDDIAPGIVKRAFFGALDEMARYWILSSTKKYKPTDCARAISEIFIQGLLASPQKGG
ncbi:MAG: TetR family transcriptional regulator [Desulfobacterota bacterium]|nr:TetR family transcriptional regulator [Thermodesulfobacteriota bacterium]